MQRFLGFDESQRTDYLSEERARVLLEEACPLLWQAVTWPWDDFQSSRRDDPRFLPFSEADAAWWMHSQIKRVVDQLCADAPELGITPHTTKDHQFYVDVRGELTIVFKKLTRVFMKRRGRDVLIRSNYPTKHNCDFWAQLKESGLVAPRAIVGYEPIKAMTEVRIHVGYPRTKGREFDWVYEMPNQAVAAREKFERKLQLAPAPVQETVEEARGFAVEPVANHENKAGAV